MNLEGKNVLIIGGSRGLGKELARSFAQSQARVMVAGRDANSLEALASEIRNEGHGILTVQGDIGSKEDVYRIVGYAFEQLGSIDVLVNNAATLGPERLQLLLDTDCEDLEKALTTNLVGPFRFIKAVAGGMMLNGGGTIINVTTDAAREPYPEWGAYGVSKAALEHLTRVFAVESVKARLNFILLDPGEMDTELHAQALPEADRNALNQPATVARTFKNFLVQSAKTTQGVPTQVVYDGSSDTMRVL